MYHCSDEIIHPECFRNWQSSLFISARKGSRFQGDEPRTFFWNDNRFYISARKAEDFSEMNMQTYDHFENDNRLFIFQIERQQVSNVNKRRSWEVNFVFRLLNMCDNNEREFTSSLSLEKCMINDKITVYIITHAPTNASKHIFHICTLTHPRLRAHIRTHIYIHTYKHTCMHTFAHTRTPMHTPRAVSWKNCSFYIF